MSQSEVRGRACPRARRGGGHVPEQCEGEGGVVPQKGGEARENDLESFVASNASLTVRAWELPQKCHVTYS
jgi:hypothetical protein